MRRLLVVAALVVGVFGIGAIAIAPRLGPAPPPAAPVLLAPAGEASTVEDLSKAISAARDRLNRLPADWLTWARLGQAYVQQARITADPRPYAQAETALNRSLELRPKDNAAALTGLGALAAARHDFAGALHYGQQAVATDAYSAAAHGVVADALVELGRYDEATNAVQQMVDLRPDTGSYARASYINELHGRLPAARELMELALQVAPTPADAAFAHQHLALLAFAAGDRATASSHVEQGLAVAPGYPPLRALRARLIAARGDTTAAIEELRAVVARLPIPEYATALGDLLSVTGDRAGAQAQYDLVRASAALFKANGVRVDLDLVVFDADRTVLDRAALALSTVDSAVAGYKERPSITAADALGWALYAAGRSSEALKYANEALRLGTRSADFHYHRGMIRAALGDKAGAKADLTEALRLNPHFSPRHATLAMDTLGALS